MNTTDDRAESAARLQRLLNFMEIDAGNLPLRKDAVRTAFDAGEWLLARQLVDVGLQAHPAEAELLALSGMISLQAQRYPEAVHELSSALEGGLDAAEIRYNLAFAHFMATRYADALEQLTDAVVAQVLTLGLLLRARCLHHLGRPLEAIADCSAHLAVAPDDAEANGLMALLLYDQHRPDEARRRADVALVQDAFQLEALLTRASIEADTHRYRAAQMSFEALLQAHPLCGRGWFGVAMLELRQMHIEEAHRYMRLAAARMPQHIGCWHGLGWIEILRGDIAAAQVAFDRALVLDRNFGETHGGLAVVAAMDGRVEAAGESARRALRLNPASMSGRYAEVLLLERAGKHQQAHALFDAMLSMPAGQGEVQYRDLVRLHVAYAQLNSPAAAVKLH